MSDRLRYFSNFLRGKDSRRGRDLKFQVVAVRRLSYTMRNYERLKDDYLRPPFTALHILLYSSELDSTLYSPQSIYNTKVWNNRISL